MITPRLMRTEAVLVLQYIPLRIHLRGERHGGKLQASDLHGLNSLSLLQAAGGSQDGGVLREEVDGPGRRALSEGTEHPLHCRRLRLIGVRWRLRG